MTKAFFFTLLLTLFSVGLVLAHVDNVKYLLPEWLRAGVFDYNTDGKTNTFDFTIDAVHPVGIHPSPNTTPLPSALVTWPTLSTRHVVSGLSSPVHITNANDGTDRIFVVEQGGRIRIIAGSTIVPTPFLDIASRIAAGGERGLLGLAFPPNYSSKRYFYVYYTNTVGSIQISRFTLSSNNNIANAASEEILLTIPKPFANHNGGTLVFGNDGYLYIGTGDGGGGGDPDNNGQNPNTLLGKLLRIDVESDVAPYTIPPTNPYVGQAGKRAEIWAMGLRNPWKFTFDRLTHDLYIADVGQNAWEEVNVQAADSVGGANYGWKQMEGAHCFVSNCIQNGMTLPVVEYHHSTGGCSITGGYVYRGSTFVRMRGIYFYGDYCSGKIWGLQKIHTQWQSQLLTTITANTLTTFGEDEQGNLYVANSGALHEVIDTGL